MKTVKVLLLVVVAAALTVAVLQNQSLWQVRFLWLTGDIPGAIMLFFAVSLGFIAGVLVALQIKIGMYPRRKVVHHEGRAA